MSNKKRKIGIGIGALLIALLVGVIIYCYPEEINQSYEGIRFRLGEDESKEDKLEEPIVVKIEGTLYPGIFKGDKFTGNIQIGDTKLTELELSIEDDSYTYLYSTGMLMFEKFNQYKSFYTKDIRKSLAFVELEINEEGNGGSWSGENGVVIAVPANNRKEGLALMNELWSGIEYTFQ